ncbi:MAG: undecaprenyl-diphosphate phosphatase [Acidobacteriota bacterium]
MTWWQAVVLGIVEGITEYLPVSSTGHLIVAERLMKLATSPAFNAYTVCIQAGAIAAVLGLYLGRVRQMVMGVLGRDREGLQLVRNIAVGFLPAAVTGLLLGSLIERYLFGLWPVVASWLVGGVVILLVARRFSGPSSVGVTLEGMGWSAALVIGVAQCVAMWPGTSRSLVTILAALLLGLSLDAAVEFSFLLGVVTLTAATGYEALKSGTAMVHTIGWGNIAIGFVTAALFAALAVKWMVGYLRRHGLQLFGYYRLAIGLAAAALLVAGILRD